MNFGDSLLSVLSGALGGGALVWLLRAWISQRLEQSIRHEYAEKLETFKGQLALQVQAIEHASQLRQLQTSLFFDHQRQAFAKLTTKIAEVSTAWTRASWAPDEGFSAGVPYEKFHELELLFIEHQLFLDQDGVMAIRLVLSCYRDSLPILDDSTGQERQRDCDTSYSYVAYLQPHVAELFRAKIALAVAPRAVQAIALLGAMRVLKHYHFHGISLAEPLRVRDGDAPGEIVIRAVEHRTALVDHLKKVADYLATETGHFPEAADEIARYLAVLRSTCP